MNFMMTQILAEVAGNSDNETLKTVLAVLGWVTSFAVAIVAALNLKSAKATSKEEGRNEVKVSLPQPFEMRMKEEFVTRREFERLEANMAGNIAEIKGMMNTTAVEMKSLFRETMTAVSSQNTTLTNKIERQHKAMTEDIGKVASAAHAGRQKIWEVVNDQREEVASLKTNSNVADQIGKLAQAISTPTTKIQPTHPNS